MSVSAPPECAWTAATQASWITDLSPASGQGSGQIQFRTGPNPTAAARHADMLINDVAVRLTQPGAACSFVLTPVSLSAGAAATSVDVVVTTVDGCAWSVVSSASWIVVSGAPSRTGSGTLVLGVSANAGAPRSGSVAVAGQTVTIDQDAVAPPPPGVACSFSIFPAARTFGPEGGPERIDVTTQPGCSWTASSNAPWITIAGAAGRTGSGPLFFVVDANGGAERAGTVTVAGQTLTATQSAAEPTTPVCTYTASPTSHLVGPSGTSGLTVTVTAPVTCAWTASSSASWLSITNGTSGSGNGSVTFSVAANAGGSRSGTLTVAGQTVTVSQASGCTYTLAPTSASFGSAGGTGTPIAVAAGATCDWTAVASDPWIAVTSGTAGSGNGTVAFSVAASTSAARTGTITVAGRTFTISQSSGCTYSVAPLSFTLNAEAATGLTIGVTAGTGCTWTAVSNKPWLTVTEGASGVGTGTVVFSVAENTGGRRDGELIVAETQVSVRQEKR